MLIHREYSSSYPAKLVIEKERIFTENGNKPYVCGNINPKESVPYPKNPIISKFFRELGLCEELGSGVRNIAKYAKIYAGYEPILTDENIFRFDWKVNLFNPIKIKTGKSVSDQDTDQDTDQVINAIIEFCSTPKSLKEIMEPYNNSQFINFSHKSIKKVLTCILNLLYNQN